MSLTGASCLIYNLFVNTFFKILLFKRGEIKNDLDRYYMPVHFVNESSNQTAPKGFKPFFILDTGKQVSDTLGNNTRGQNYFNIALVLQDEGLTIFSCLANTCSCTCPLKSYTIQNIRE